MLKLKKVAITGNTASGKSQVCRMLAENGAFIVDSDEIVHQLLNPDTKLGRKVIELLGNEIVVDGKIDRVRVAKKVFSDPKLLNSLEEILHPAVYEEITRRYKEICRQKKLPPLFIAEIPLLFETNGARFFDNTVVITANTHLCSERYQKSTGYAHEDFSKRRARMFDEQEKVKCADYVIENNGTLQNLRLEVNRLFDTLCEIKEKN